jgi:Cation transporter/ATPase, N-terminus
MSQSLTSVAQGIGPWHVRDARQGGCNPEGGSWPRSRGDRRRERRARFGSNRLREAEREPTWRALLRPFQDLPALRRMTVA